MHDNIHYDDMLRLLGRALGDPSRYTRKSVAAHEWNLAADCARPRVLSLRATSSGPEDAGRLRAIGPALRRKEKAGEVGPVASPKGTGRGARFVHKAASRIWCDLRVRCRSCPQCLLSRQRMWATRIHREASAVSLSAFVTLTYRPEERYSRSIRAEVLARTAGLTRDDYRGDTVSEWYTVACKPDVTMFIQRLRRRWGLPFRYVCVSELHADGWPHHHLIISRRGSPSEWRISPAGRTGDIRDCWPHGFSQTLRLRDTDSEVFHYIAKYLGKAKGARVRASLGYGNPVLDDRPTDSVGREALTTRASGLLPRGFEEPDGWDNATAHAVASAVRDAQLSYRPDDNSRRYDPRPVTELHAEIRTSLDETLLEGYEGEQGVSG